MVLSALFTLLAVSGCQSDRDYQARAADRAREYLLANAPELDSAQTSYVRYNDPILLTGDGLSGKVNGSAAHRGDDGLRDIYRKNPRPCQEKQKGRLAMYSIRNVNGHIQVYDVRGRFLFSADTEREAREELMEYAQSAA